MNAPLSAADILALVANPERPLTVLENNKAVRRTVEARITARMATGELVHFEEALLDQLERLNAASRELQQQLERIQRDATNSLARLANGRITVDDVSSIPVARATAVAERVSHLIDDVQFAATAMAKHSEQLQATPEQRAATLQGLAEARAQRIKSRFEGLMKQSAEELLEYAAQQGLAFPPRPRKQDVATALATKLEDAKAGAR